MNKAFGRGAEIEEMKESEKNEDDIEKKRSEAWWERGSGRGRERHSYIYILIQNYGYYLADSIYTDQ